METMLKAEMEEHLGYKKHDPTGNKTGNSRNGTSSKTLKTNIGEIPLEAPRDRNATFEPVVVPKHQRMLLPGIRNAVKMGTGVQQEWEQEYSKIGNRNAVIS